MRYPFQRLPEGTDLKKTRRKTAAAAADTDIRNFLCSLMMIYATSEVKMRFRSRIREDIPQILQKENDPVLPSSACIQEYRRCRAFCLSRSAFSPECRLHGAR